MIFEVFVQPFLDAQPFNGRILKMHPAIAFADMVNRFVLSGAFLLGKELVLDSR